MKFKLIRTYFLLRWLLARRKGVRFLAAARIISLCPALIATVDRLMKLLLISQSNRIINLTDSSQSWVEGQL